jgi:hypothetical protein
MSSLINSILNNINHGKCEKLIKYQNRSFEFKGISAEFPGGKLSFGGVSTELKNIDSIAETAKALDDFHYNLCNDLSNPSLKENLSKDDLRMYTKMLFGAHACILNFRSSLDAFSKDPQGQSANLDKSLTMMRNFLSSVTPAFITEEGRNAIAESLSSAGLHEKQIDEAISSNTS